MYKKTENIFFPCNLMSPFPDVPFSQLGRICSSEDRNYYEVIPEGNLKSVYYLAVFIYLILILQPHAFIPKILLVNLLTVLPSILIILVWTIWCWIDL